MARQSPTFVMPFASASPPARPAPAPDRATGPATLTASTRPTLTHLVNAIRGFQRSDDEYGTVQDGITLDALQYATHGTDAIVLRDNFMYLKGTLGPRMTHATLEQWMRVWNRDMMTCFAGYVALREKLKDRLWKTGIEPEFNVVHLKQELKHYVLRLADTCSPVHTLSFQRRPDTYYFNA